ncbi:MAG: G5 domain-containing protein [Limnochordia bacterium]
MDISPARQLSEASIAVRRHQRFVVRGTLFLMLAVGAIFALREVALKRVSIYVEGSEPVVVTTTAWRVGAVLSQVGVQLFDGDIVTPAVSNRLREGQVIQVKRAFTVRIAADGQLHEIRTTEVSVQALLDMVGLTVGTDDKVIPQVNARLSGEDTIRVIRVTYDHTTETQAITFKTVRKSDPSMDQGTTRVTKQGKNGTLEKTIKRTYEDGKLVKRSVVGEKVTVQPVDAIIHVGTRPVPKTIRASSGKLLQYTDMKELLATAYTPLDGSGAGITYTGIKATKGVVAVDPRVIPLGSRLYIPGYGEALAADTGSAIKGLRIDLCYESRREALQFGRRVVKVYILAKR